MRQKEYSSIMNKNTAYVLSAALALSVCGCSTQTTSSPADSSSGLSVPGAAASSGSIATFSFSTLPKAPREAISQKTPRKLTPEQQKAESEFNKKLSSARQEINRGKYALTVAIPGIFMVIVTFWAGYLQVFTQYLPAGQNLLAVLGLIVMFLMVIVLVGAFRKWAQLMKIKTTIKDEYGEEVKALAVE